MTFGWFWLPPDHSLDDTTRTAFMPPHRLTNPNGLLLRVECTAAPLVKSGRKTPEIHFMFDVTSISVLNSNPSYSLSSLLQSTVIACNRDGLTVINLYLWHFLGALIYIVHNSKNGLSSSCNCTQSPLSSNARQPPTWWCWGWWQKTVLWAMEYLPVSPVSYLTLKA